MAKSKYLTLLSQSNLIRAEESLNEEKESEAKLATDAQILETKKRLNATKLDLAKAQTADESFDAKRIYDLRIQVKLLEDQAKGLSEIRDEMFGIQ